MPHQRPRILRCGAAVGETTSVGVDAKDKERGLVLGDLDAEMWSRIRLDQAAAW